MGLTSARAIRLSTGVLEAKSTTTAGILRGGITGSSLFAAMYVLVGHAAFEAMSSVAIPREL